MPPNCVIFPARGSRGESDNNVRHEDSGLLVIMTGLEETVCVVLRRVLWPDKDRRKRELTYCCVIYGVSKWDANGKIRGNCMRCLTYVVLIYWVSE